VGATGADAFADTALSLLRAEGVDLTTVGNAALPTGAAFISIDAKGQNAITVAAGANAAVRGAQVEALPLHATDTLLLQREVPDAEGEIAARSAKARGARVILNLAPSGVPKESYLHAIDILVMNEHEAADLGTGLGLGTGYPVLARNLHDRFNMVTVITLGPEGALVWAGATLHNAAALPVNVVDTTAAGDTFTGAFAAALDEGLGLSQALQRGVAAGSLACTKHGAQPSIPTRAEIDAAIAVH
jgi:ribokinase